MADHIEKYFRGELSKAEYGALAKQLASSGETADRFIEKAEAVYFQYGLPDPGGHGGGGHYFKTVWGKLLLVVAAGAVAVGYRWMRAENPQIPRPVSALTPVVKLTSKPEQPVVKPPLPAEKTAARMPREKPASVAPEKAPPGSGIETDYHKLSVVVEQGNDGIVAVKVLGPDGSEVRRLYEGPLESGRWAFTWDGKLDDGRPAAPATYRIEVKGDSGSEDQEVILRDKNLKP